MGWNGSGGVNLAKPKSRRKERRFVSRGIYAGIAAVSLVGVVFLALFYAVGDRNEVDEHAVPVRADAGRIPKPKASVVSRLPDGRAASSMSGKETKAEPIAKAEIESPPPQQELETEVLEDGLILSEVPTNMPSHLRNPYKSQVESLLSMLGKPGTPYTPIPLDPNMDLEEDFIKAMENTIIVWEDESTRSEEHKRMVNWMKNAVAEARKEGWKVADLLKALEQERKEQWEMVSEAQSILGEAEEVAPEFTTALREALNKELAQEGIDPLPKADMEDEVPQQKVETEGAP